MRRFRALLLFVTVVACHEDQTGPTDGPPRPALAIAGEETGPPAAYPFGPDSYRVGAFTGEGVTRPELQCEKGAGTTRRCTGFLASAVDGARLDVNLELPGRTGPYPLVVLVHGYAGGKNSSGDIATRLLAEGYAVLRYTTRGFGDSWGQVNMSDPNAEIADLHSMVAQVVDRKQYDINADAVAVTGASYGGGHSWLSALQPRFTTPGGNAVRIRTVVPIASWSDLLYSLIPNGRERRSVDAPGGLKLSFVNGLYGSGIRRNTKRPYPNYPDYFVAWHAWINANEPAALDPVYRSAVDGLAGHRSIWWQQRFWEAAVSDPLPIFQIVGLTDDLFPLPEAKRMLLALKSVNPDYPIATYLGDIGHPRASNKPGEVEYVLDLTSTWLAYYLKNEGTAPPNVIYAALTRPRDEPFNAANVQVFTDYDALSSTMLMAQLSEPTILINPAADPMAGFAWDPFVMELSRELQPLPEPPSSPVVPGSLGTYDIPVASLAPGPIEISGQPAVVLHASTAAWRVQLNVRLFEVVGTEKKLITRGTYTLDSGIPGVSIGEADVRIVTYGNRWRAAGTSTLRLEITNVDSPYLTPSRVPSVTVVSGISLEVPVR
jgi:ABC-2 type transport system ATP-binding protein